MAWYSGYRQVGLPSGTHRGLPSPFLTLILTLDDPLLIDRHPDPAQPAARYDALVGGLHTTPAIIVHDGHQSGIQVALHPLASPALLGCPAGELAGQDLPAEAVLGARTDLLRERILSAGTWDERLAALEEGLVGLLAQDRAGPPPALWHAWGSLVATRGQMSVESLAREVGWSDRQLRAQMLRWTGLSPKAAARVIRFDAARRALAVRVAAGRRWGLARLAVERGYYDQAHLAREFNALAGCAPSRWVAEELRNIQAGAHAEAGGSTL